MMRKKTVIFILLVSLTAVAVSASELVETALVTDKVILLHFDDGYIDYHGYHEENSDDKTVAEPLDTEKATSPGSYTVSSEDDPRFAAGLSPLRVARKSKGMDWSRNCKWTGKQCDNDVVFEHWLYLELPAAMKREASYTVRMPGIAENLETVTVKFDEFRMRSEAVHVNHLGYIPSARRKYAYVWQWMGDGGPLRLDDYGDTPFHLVRTSDKSIVFSG